MRKPPVLQADDEAVSVGRVFGTPLMAKGYTWFPLTQCIVWGIMVRVAGKERPDRSSGERMRLAALTMPVVLGSEWGHNLAHAAVANWIGKPMDAIRITWGMPLCVYFDIEDASVTPRQHISRALGGPLFSFTLLLSSLAVQRLAPKGSSAREVANVSVVTNAFLSAVSLLPIPGIDGGPILKWSLVDRGRTVEEANQVIRKVDGGLGIALSFLSRAAIRKGRRVIGLLSAMLAMLSFGVAFGWIREQD
ncbi:MAG: hypothetical protein KAR65_04115 [Anaerolineales bacterium]|nr:hypothetical protein [Anaerolineales bacterium]